MGYQIIEGAPPVRARKLVSHKFDAVPEAVPAARKLVKQISSIKPENRPRVLSLFPWRVPSPRVSEGKISDAKLVVSEAATNAIQTLTGKRQPEPASEGQVDGHEFTVEVAVVTRPRNRRGGLLICVSDPRPDALPRRQQAKETNASGRGIQIIEAAADQSGVKINASNKTVWALFESDEPPSQPVRTALARALQPLHRLRSAA